ncbi:type II secretion system F family protein [Streptomyces sp. KLOTTS4A1]|uniref:type II secretion system F family protein n=1 Tax=Streptomyces sp. KLOTTS4A1 TaxID=3390996 RepID=UPI0039F4FC46
MGRAQLTLLAIAGALVFLSGVYGTVAAVRGKPLTVRRRRRGGLRTAIEELPDPWRNNYRTVVGAAVIGAVLVWVATGRPVHGLVVFIAVAGLPFLLHPGGSARAETEQLEAMSDWLQQVASLVSSGRPIDQALHATLPTIPAPLQSPVSLLAVRLSDGMPPAQAYRLLADDLGTLSGDDLTQVLMMHTQTRGAGLAEVLKQMAIKTADKAKGLRELDAARARTRRRARNVTIMTLAVIAMGLTGAGYTSWYATGAGQLGLTLVSAVVAGSLFWLRKRAQMDEEPRQLRTAQERAAPLEGGA